MSTEVEIKFVVKPEFKTVLAAELKKYTLINQGVKPLSNTYFDTVTYQFRQFDFGLRTRRSLDFAEQTIKTAGVVRGGLHQRPEYNLPLVGEFPTLADFPAEMWPADADVGQLQADLVELFTTDFERTLWHIKLDNGAEIEVVFDNGMVRAGDNSFPICEVELELITGAVDDLFMLAQSISKLGGVRLGNVSKAKRGYQLAGLHQPEVTPLTLSKDDNATTLSNIFFNTLSQSYQHWQHHEQLYLETQDELALGEVVRSIDLIQQTMLTYQDVLPVLNQQKNEINWLQTQLANVSHVLNLQQIVLNNGHFIRNFPEHKRILKELSTLRDNSLNFEDIEALMCSSRYTLIMLAISRLLNDNIDKYHINEEVDAFAAMHLESSWQNILNSVLSKESLQIDDYLVIKPELKRNVLVGACFNHLYVPESRKKFRLPWLDIIEGIEDLEVIRLLSNIAQLQPETVTEQIEKILQRKQASLLDALEQTREQAISLQPYWR